MSKNDPQPNPNAPKSNDAAAAPQGAPGGPSAQHAQGQAQAQPAAPRAPWDLPLPFTLPTPEAFGQMMRDQIARTQSMMDELAVYESVATQRARTAVNDLAKLATDSIGYVAQLSAEWRKVALDAGRRTIDAFGPKN